MSKKSRLWVELEPEVSEATLGGARLSHPATFAMETPTGVIIQQAAMMVFVPGVRIVDGRLASPARGPVAEATELVAAAKKAVDANTETEQAHALNALGKQVELWCEGRR